MNKKLLDKFKETNTIPTFHGNEMLDLLKHLSELENVPEIVCMDYYEQYEKALANMGTSNNWGLGKVLYSHFNGDGDIIIHNTLDTVVWGNVTVKTFEIEIPYFAKMNNYISEHKDTIRPSKKVDSRFTIIDVIIDDVSMFNTVGNKKMRGNMSAYIDMFYLINDRDYTIMNNFVYPYNGIRSTSIPDIFRKIIKETDNDATIASYIERLSGNLSYYTGITVKHDYKNKKFVIYDN